MTTLAKIQASRRNALKSTGPRTPQGKAISSRNALKHGLDARSLSCDEGRLERSLFRTFREWSKRTHLSPLFSTNRSPKNLGEPKIEPNPVARLLPPAGQ